MDTDCPHHTAMRHSDSNEELDLLVDTEADETVRDSFARGVGSGGRNDRAYMQVWLNVDDPDADPDDDEVLMIRFNPTLQPDAWGRPSKSTEPLLLCFWPSDTVGRVLERLAETKYSDGATVIPMGCHHCFMSRDVCPVPSSATLSQLLSIRVQNCNLVCLRVWGYGVSKCAWL